MNLKLNFSSLPHELMLFPFTVLNDAVSYFVRCGNQDLIIYFCKIIALKALYEKKGLL